MVNNAKAKYCIANDSRAVHKAPQARAYPTETLETGKPPERPTTHVLTHHGAEQRSESDSVCKQGRVGPRWSIEGLSWPWSGVD